MYTFICRFLSYQFYVHNIFEMNLYYKGKEVTPDLYCIEWFNVAIQLDGLSPMHPYSGANFTGICTPTP